MHIIRFEIICRIFHLCFIYNAICVISDLSTNKAGTITSGLDRFMEWKMKDGNHEDTAYAQFDAFYEGMFQKKNAC